MPLGAVGRFADASDYQENLREMAVELVITRPGAFDARLTWAKLPHMSLLRAEEALPRIAYIVLPSGSVSISFCTTAGAAVLWNGTEVRAGDLVIHSRGERLHQRTTGTSRWGLLSVAPGFLATFAGALAGEALVLPREGAILRPSQRDFSRFLDRHGAVAGLIETRPISVGHPEIVRSIEHELLYMLVACLTGGERRSPSRTRRQHAAIMVQFEGALADYPDRLVSVAELCARIYVSERTFRTCCIEIFGMGPSAYMRLRRLKDARTAMVRADGATTRVGDVAKRFGFQELSRFGAAYRTAFGETPSTTLRRAQNPTRTF